MCMCMLCMLCYVGAVAGGGVRPRQPRLEMDLSLSSGKRGQGEYGGNVGCGCLHKQFRRPNCML